MAVHLPIAAPETVRTACPYCGVGCGIVVQRSASNRLSLAGDPDHPSNRGQLCSKGRTLLHAALRDETRLLRPELRPHRSAPREAVSWDEAVGHLAERFGAIQARHGRDAVALYLSGQCLTEEYYYANKLAKGFLRTNNIDSNSRLCMSSAVSGHRLTLGSDCVPGTYADLDLADTWLVCGANMAFAHPVLFRRIEARKAAHPEAKLIVVDPRRTDTAALADLHLAIRPGTDVALHHALGHCLLEWGAIDREWIDAHAHGWEALASVLRAWTPERAGAVCGIAPADIRTAASWLRAPRRWMSLWTMGLNQSSSGTAKVASLINLSLITGTVGRPGCGPFSLTGQPNAMGGREVGAMANLLSAHRSLEDRRHRAEVEDAWGVPRGSIPGTPGLTAVELFDAVRSGRVKAVWIVATNPVASLPAGLGVDAALRRAELVVVQDAYANDTLPFADVVLPAATWLEKTGTMTNAERRVHLVEKLRDPPGLALPDLEIIRRVAHALGFARGFPHTDPAAVWTEHAALTRGSDCDVSGLTHESLRARRAAQWPVPGCEHPGTPRLFHDGRFPTADGRCRLWAGEPDDRTEGCDAAHPLVLTTGRIRDQWHTQTRSGLVNKLARTEPQPFCEIHPHDAATRGVSSGTILQVSSRRGAFRVRARVTADIRPGVVFVPMHWGPLLAGADGRVNAATSARLDASSKEPDLKWAAVEVRRYRPSPRRIVVVGAGAAARAFVSAHLDACPDDRLIVIGDEASGFYDRVQLPHLIAERRRWEDLRRDLSAQKLQVRTGIPVLAIDRVARTVRLADGSEEAYDHCILATGSRAATPESLPATGCAVLRNRADAVAIRHRFGIGSHVAIVGAGLLGLELAAALRTRGCRVTILQRSARLMGKQLDATAARRLAELVRGRGIALRFGARLTGMHDGGRGSVLALDEGTALECDGVIFATGTTPEDTLARASGLACAPGVVVDRHLATVDENVSAIGECCVADGHRVGTTSGAAAQATALSARLAGDPAAVWQPTPEPRVLKIEGIELASIGDVEEGPGDEVVVREDRDRYVKVVIRADRVVGALCLGDLQPWPRLKDLVRSGVELDELRAGLLRSDAPTAEGRIVCACFQVGELTLSRVARAERGEVARVCTVTGAGTGCGSCRMEIARICAAQGTGPDHEASAA